MTTPFRARYGLEVYANTLVANVTTGYVGIGTATPNNALDVMGSVSFAPYGLSTNQSAFDFTSPSGSNTYFRIRNTSFAYNQNYDMFIGTSGALNYIRNGNYSNFAIDAGSASTGLFLNAYQAVGKAVGIGTTLPTAKLTIASGTNPNDIHLYGTYTNASNYERLRFLANSTAAYITTENLGTGVARPLYFGANGSTAMIVDDSSDTSLAGSLYLGIAKNGPRLMAASTTTLDLLVSGTTTAARIASTRVAILGEFGIGSAVAPDVFLARDAANILAQRNSTVNQTFRLYGTYTDASNYERLSLSVNATAGYIQTENLGTGVGRSLYLGANGTTAMTIDTSRRIGIGTTAPEKQLHVAGSADIYLVGSAPSLQFRTDPSSQFYFFWNGSKMVGSTWDGSSWKDALTIEKSVPANTLYLRSTGNVGIGTASPTYKLEVAGSFAAQTKSFVIEHQSKPNHMLRHGSLEGPENGVYVRGRNQGTTIYLPEYWKWLVDENTVTVSLTPIGNTEMPYVISADNEKIVVGSREDRMDYFYHVFGERKDVDRMIVEYEK